MIADVIYRPPNTDPREFVLKLSDILDAVGKEKYHISRLILIWTCWHVMNIRLQWSIWIYVCLVLSANDNQAHTSYTENIHFVR